MSGPSSPHLTPREWAHVEALCTINANRANAPIRTKIADYFAARTLAASKDENVGPNPARGTVAIHAPDATDATDTS